jgi:peptide/nickel transport system ATP-binding protein/oligopeptide transport system ATP-binding protein
VSLLAIEDLHVHFAARGLDNRLRVARALNGVDLQVRRGEIHGLVGETGAGKSLTAYAVLGLLRDSARVVAGRIRFDGTDLLGVPEAALPGLRGRRLALVVQNPRTSLDPLARIGDQIIGVRRAHFPREPMAESRRRALDMLARVGIADPAARLRAWPHEFSGGMAQRVAIAMALINEPELLIADEPTTGLDVTVQAQILDLLRGLVRARGMAALLITHDLGVVAQHCDGVAVMYAGRVVEDGPVGRVLVTPRHPYAVALTSAVPERLRLGAGQVFGGTPPDLQALPAGCAYRDRCGAATPACALPPPLRHDGAGGLVLCHHPVPA